MPGFVLIVLISHTFTTGSPTNQPNYKVRHLGFGQVWLFQVLGVERGL
jgi:hypothetical protein